ncbi:MAG: hypothetical protein HYR56_19325 [Acidobacteria bacterium]|nr:hypothetical protein [Acidobacteriota bacterium]MBI3424199.1 hypothetical protein [Acidobacteriota bacterium]
MAWRIPPVLAQVPAFGSEKPVGSMVPWAQTQLFHATRQALAAVAQDIANGLAETVGIRCAWGTELAADERCSVVLELPPEANVDYIAHAIDLENVEAWCADDQMVHVAIGPWYSVKDVDQVVLSITKVTHVKLGLHATDRQRAQAAQKS